MLVLSHFSVVVLDPGAAYRESVRRAARVSEREARVALERREQVAGRQLELAPAELDERLVGSRVVPTADRQLADRGARPARLTWGW